MKRCKECGSASDVRSVEVINIFGDRKVKLASVCLDCLRLKNFYCEEHGVHLLILENGSGSEVRSACPGCAFEATKKMEPGRRFQLLELLKRNIPPEILQETMIFGIGGATEDEKIIGGICLLGRFYSRTPEQAVSDLISGREDGFVLQ